jgi:hypothetical protein
MKIGRVYILAFLCIRGISCGTFRIRRLNHLVFHLKKGVDICDDGCGALWLSSRVDNGNSHFLMPDTFLTAIISILNNRNIGFVYLLAW